VSADDTPNAEPAATPGDPRTGLTIAVSVSFYDRIQEGEPFRFAKVSDATYAVLTDRIAADHAAYLDADLIKLIEDAEDCE
jgi:hypothetical protein